MNLNVFGILDYTTVVMEMLSGGYRMHSSGINVRFPDWWPWGYGFTIMIATWQSTKNDNLGGRYN